MPSNRVVKIRSSGDSVSAREMRDGIAAIQAEQKVSPTFAPAVEEAARWHSPVGTSTRQATRDTELAGVPLEKGALIAAVLSSANRDDRHWNEPDRFDIDAHRRPHLAFAGGSHVCVGALLGRYEARIALRALLERLPGLRLDPDRPAAFSGWEFRSPEHIDLLFDGARA